MLSVASNVAAVLGSTWTWGGSRRSIVIVTGTLLEEKGSRAEAFRLGCHLHCPDTIVSRDEAMKLRAALVDKLRGNRKTSRKDWENCRSVGL
jgi:hypothetical protein